MHYHPRHWEARRVFDPTVSFGELAARAWDCDPPTRDEALGVLQCADDDLLPLPQAAFRVRQKTFARGVTLHVLRNAKSGL